MNISIDDGHRNVLIIDKKRALLQYFEPNMKSEESDPIFYEKNIKQYDLTRNTILDIILSIPEYREYKVAPRWRNFYQMYEYMTKYIAWEFDPKYMEKAWCSPCTGICYYFIVKYINGEDTFKYPKMYIDMLKVLTELVQPIYDKYGTSSMDMWTMNDDDIVAYVINFKDIVGDFNAPYLGEGW